jgi:hypothetical protein
VQSAVLPSRGNRWPAVRLFVALAIVIYAIEIAIVRSPRFAVRPDLVAFAATLDLTVVIPLIYWLIVVRRNGAPVISLAGVYLASLAGASVVIPSGRHQFLKVAELLALPVEIGVCWLIVREVQRAKAAIRSLDSEDLPERIEAALGEALGNRRLAAVLAMEVAILYYAFAAWRRPRYAPAGTLPFSYHVQSSLAAIFGTLVLASVGETIAVHFLIRTASPRAAWTLTIVSVIGVVWLMGYLRATILRPVLLSETELFVRTGLQWKLDVPLTAIERVVIGRVPAPRKGEPGVLRAVPFGQPNVALSLATPMRAKGAYGTERVVTRVVLTIDDRRGFEHALRERLDSARFA